MTWSNLPVDYTNALYSGFRKYVMIDNGDGTISFQDVTDYTQEEHSFFNANDANSMNGAINDIMNNKGDMFSVNDAPFDSKFYARKNGNWSEVTGGGGGGTWGSIVGTLSDQSDLQSALNSKLDELMPKADGSLSIWNSIIKGDTSRLSTGEYLRFLDKNDSRFAVIQIKNDHGTNVFSVKIYADSSSTPVELITASRLNASPYTFSLSTSDTSAWVDMLGLSEMAFIGDASSDGHTYGRKDGSWVAVETSGSPAVNWGDITGSLSDQTDLQAALDLKFDSGSIVDEFDPTYSYPSGTNYVTYKGGLYSFSGPYQGDFEDIPSCLSVDLSYLMSLKANIADLGDLAYLNTIDYTGNKLTNKPSLGGMSAIDDAPTDGKYYGRKNGGWYEVIGDPEGRVDWGEIAGSMSNQTDLITVLDAKTNSTAIVDEFDSTYSYPSGANYVMYQGDLWKIFGPYQGDFDDIPTKEKKNLSYLLSLKQNVLTFDNTPTSGSVNPVESGGIYIALAGKQDVLTFDSSATSGSSNPVTSDGIYQDLTGKQDTLTFDNSATSGSANPVTSDGIYQGLAAKQNTLTFDSSATSGSLNPVTSDGVYQGLAGKSDTSHNHDSRYYTESEIDTTLANYALKSNLMMGVYINNSPLTTATIYDLYHTARGLYGTGTWMYVIVVGQIGGTATLAQSLPVVPCVITIIQYNHASQERAVFTCQGVSQSVIKHAHVWQGTMSNWY